MTFSRTGPVVLAGVLLLTGCATATAGDAEPSPGPVTHDPSPTASPTPTAPPTALPAIDLTCDELVAEEARTTALAGDVQAWAYPLTAIDVTTAQAGMLTCLWRSDDGSRMVSLSVDSDPARTLTVPDDDGEEHTTDAADTLGDESVISCGGSGNTDGSVSSSCRALVRTGEYVFEVFLRFPDPAQRSESVARAEAFAAGVVDAVTSAGAPREAFAVDPTVELPAWGERDGWCEGLDPESRVAAVVPALSGGGVGPWGTDYESALLHAALLEVQPASCVWSSGDSGAGGMIEMHVVPGGSWAWPILEESRAGSEEAQVEGADSALLGCAEGTCLVDMVAGQDLYLIESTIGGVTEQELLAGAGEILALVSR